MQAIGLKAINLQGSEVAATSLDRIKKKLKSMQENAKQRLAIGLKAIN